MKILDGLNDGVGLFGMFFAYSECKMSLSGWVGSKLVLAGEKLSELGTFGFLNSCISLGGSILGELCSPMQIARFALTTLRHLWRRRDIRL